MSKSLKDKTVTGVFWSTINTGGNQVIGFMVGLILARQLGPNAFGLIASISIFISITHILADSGLGQALIQNKHANQVDYSTAFYFNLILSLFLYSLLYYLSPFISNFYNEPILEILIKIIGISVIIQSLKINQYVKLSKQMNFKLHAKISIPSTVISGAISIWMVYHNYGIWSYVCLIILTPTLATTMLWFTVKWLPSLEFSRQSLKNMFSFGSKLIIVGLFDTLQKNIINIIIGKYFGMADLGYYNRAETIKKAPSITLMKILQRVFFPVFSEIQNDDKRILNGLKKTIRVTSIISFPIIFFLIVLAKPIVLVLLGASWLPMVVFLQLLSFSAILYPIETIYQIYLKSKGDSKNILIIETFKLFLMVPIIVIGIKYGIEFFIYGLIGKSIIGYFIYAFKIRDQMSFTIYSQINQLFSAILYTAVMTIIILLSLSITGSHPLINLIVGFSVGVFSYIILNEYFDNKDYKEIKYLILSKL